MTTTRDESLCSPQISSDIKYHLELFCFSKEELRPGHTIPLVQHDLVGPQSRNPKILRISLRRPTALICRMIHRSGSVGGGTTFSK